MATMRILTAAGLFLAFCALGLLTMAISTDYWYETDARRHRERCKKYASKRIDPGYIYISSQNLPLRMRPNGNDVERTKTIEGAFLRVRRESIAPAAGIESRCSRRFNSTVTGLWRKCHREGFDLENEDLIFKGRICYLSVILGPLQITSRDYLNNTVTLQLPHAPSCCLCY